MSGPRPAARLNQFFRISRLLAGKLDFLSAIRSVADEIAEIIAHDHLDVCIVRPDGKVHTAYESGIDTAWGGRPNCPVSFSPIRALLMGEVDHIISRDATSDPQFHFEGAFVRPIHDHDLRSRLHLPMTVHGEVIGALSFSLHELDRYGMTDIRNGRYIAELVSPYFFALRAAEQARQSAIVETAARAREEGLRQGALRLAEALEAERQRLGMDLHDQTLADLTRLSRRLDRLSRAQDIDRAELDGACEALQASMAALRGLIDEAKPTVLHLFGFAQAVENHLQHAIRDSGHPIKVELVDESGGMIDAMPASTSVALFRIVQEAINNAVNHAAADCLRVELGVEYGQVAASVTDDGRGLTQFYRPGGSGIDNMQTRARLIGARFSLGPGREDKGTVMRVALPLADTHLEMRSAS